MTNAFSTRHQNKDKIEDLYRSIRHVINEIAYLRDNSESRYAEYIYQLKKILPSEEAFALPAEAIAARLSDDEDEQRSIRASLRGLARGAEQARLGISPTMPALKTSRHTTTRHFAELDDEDKPIRKWDVETTTTNYYLDQKKG